MFGYFLHQCFLEPAGLVSNTELALVTKCVCLAISELSSQSNCFGLNAVRDLGLCAWGQLNPLFEKFVYALSSTSSGVNCPRVF